ncbi:hypothetical protein [Bacillus sp. Marseille-P3661]|uniref:hypothetical protein n=1 Tax=Bacillus sp. Marseille-P3661 TaxID=1936234 RepID=UPI000C82EDE3|nr:hypothetical protein [Bacillus sp. Marseille-P3661]
MFNMPNYKEFYQKALIPMREYDMENFCIKFCNDCDNCIKANHWLIALEGSTSSEKSEMYVWKVVVYPAKETGVFGALNLPYYKSKTYMAFSEADEESKRIIQKINVAQLTAEMMVS